MCVKPYTNSQIILYESLIISGFQGMGATMARQTSAQFARQICPCPAKIAG
jgi:hypothetical protein